MRRVLFLENYFIASAPFVLCFKVWSKTSSLYKTFHQQSIWDHEKLPKVWQGYFRRWRPGREKQQLPRHVNLNIICLFFSMSYFGHSKASDIMADFSQFENLFHDGLFIFSDLWIGNLFSIFILQALHVSAVQPWSHALHSTKAIWATWGHVVSQVNCLKLRVKLNMRQLQMLQKVEYGGGQIFKVVLEC